jgi:hypothetical protein
MHYNTDDVNGAKLSKLENIERLLQRLNSNMEKAAERADETPVEKEARRVAAAVRAAERTQKATIGVSHARHGLRSEDSDSASTAAGWFIIAGIVLAVFLLVATIIGMTLDSDPGQRKAGLFGLGIIALFVGGCFKEWMADPSRSKTPPVHPHQAVRGGF